MTKSPSHQVTKSPSTLMAYATLPLMFLLFLVTSCSKNELLVTPYGSEGTPPTRPVEDRTTAVTYPQVTIINGVLHFSSIESFNQVVLSIDTLTNDQLVSWQDQINFKSTWYYYTKALQSISCEDPDSCNVPAVAQVYSGKIIFDSLENDILPLFPERSRGWIMGLDCKFFVGNTLVKYKDGYFISILDGSESKIPTSITAEVTDTIQGIFAHTLIANRTFCSGGCNKILDCPSVQSGNNRRDHRIKKAYIANYNLSYGAILPQGSFWAIDYRFALFFHQQRKTAIGWTVCERTIWNFTARQKATLLGLPASAPFLPTGFSNLSNLNFVNVTTGNECKYNFEATIFNLVVPIQYQNQVCLFIDEHSLTVTALDKNLTTSNFCR